MRRLLREQDQAGALPAALAISRDAKSRCRSEPQGSDCGGSTPPSRSLGSQTLIVKSRLLTGENSVQIRGDPPAFARRTAKTKLPRRSFERSRPNRTRPSSFGPAGHSASVVKLRSSSASNGEFAGGSPAGCTNSRRVSPTTRDAPLRTERLGWKSLTRHQCSCSPT